MTSKPAENFRLRDFTIPMISYYRYCDRVDKEYGHGEGTVIGDHPKNIQHRILGLAVYNAVYTIAVGVGAFIGVAAGLEKILGN